MHPQCPIRAVFLDVDGLLLDTEDCYAECIQSLLAENFCPSMPENIIAGVAGVQEKLKVDIVRDWVTNYVLGKGKWATEEEFVKEATERWTLARAKVNTLPGVEDLIRTLTTNAWMPDGHVKKGSCSRPNQQQLGKERIEVWLVSNTIMASLETKTERHKKIFELISPQKKLCSDDERLKAYPRKHKPAPDLYLAALSILNEERTSVKGSMAICADECLVFEDSVIGVEAAVRAGMRVVWVPHPSVRKAYRGLEQSVLSGTLPTEHRHNPAVALGMSNNIPVEGCSRNAALGVMMESLLGFDFVQYGIATNEKSVD